MSSKKRIVVIGITGNQGGSVARRFLEDPTYQVAGVTRNASSPVAREFAAKGADIIQADLDDLPGLTAAFKGANLIFTVTNYWEPFFTPACRDTAASRKISIREYAGEVERRHGRNLADAAAATVDTLVDNGFIVSTLSHAGRCSNGRFTDLYHFDAKADVFPFYVQETHPKLAAKMSCVHTGFFTSSHRMVPNFYFRKQEDDSYVMNFPQSPDVPVPQLYVTHDTGPFVYAVSQLPPGKDYMAASTLCTWTEYMQTWSEVTGQKATYQQLTLEEFISIHSFDKEFALEVGLMFEYSSDPGYDGGMELLGPEEIKKLGIDCPMVPLRDWMKKEDWSGVLSQTQCVVVARKSLL